jgi:hypothetical protein
MELLMLLTYASICYVIFKAFKVPVNKNVIDAVAQGQLQPGGALLDPEERVGQGRAIAEIDVDDDLSGYQLPGGAAAQVAVYTDYTEHWHHFAIIRRILLRMKSWENYVFLEGH